MIKIGLKGTKAGFKFGLTLGFFIWATLAIGLVSISRAPYLLLLGWVLGQTLELGLAGAILGYGFDKKNLKKISIWCISIFFVSLILSIVLQNVLKQ